MAEQGQAARFAERVDEIIAANGVEERVEYAAFASRPNVHFHRPHTESIARFGSVIVKRAQVLVRNEDLIAQRSVEFTSEQIRVYALEGAETIARSMTVGFDLRFAMARQLAGGCTTRRDLSEEEQEGVNTWLERPYAVPSPVSWLRVLVPSEEAAVQEAREKAEQLDERYNNILRPRSSMQTDLQRRLARRLTATKRR